MKLKVRSIWINVIPLIYLAFALLYYFVRPKSLLSTDEALYLSAPNIFNGLGVFLVQGFFYITGQSRLIIVFLIFFIIRYTLREIDKFENRKVSNSLFLFFCLSIFNPYFIFHSSSFLKDTLLSAFLVLFVILFNKKRYFIAMVFFLIAITLRMPLIIIFLSLFIFYKFSSLIPRRTGRIIFNLLVVMVYILGVTTFGESDYYISLVKVFENQRYDGGLTILNLNQDFFLFGIVVLINPILSFIGEFFNPLGSNLLIANSIYWIVFFISTAYIKLECKKSFLIPVYMSTLILTLPQVFLETAARYNLMIPFIFFVYFFWIHRDEINKVS